MRIVSLVPSATESLLEWGVTPVACTRFCERPELPHVGGTKDADIDAVIDLRPDLVVLCEEENRREHHDELTAAGLDTFVFRVDDVDDVRPQLALLAERVGAGGVEEWSLPAGVVPTLSAFVPIWRRPWMTLSAGTYGASLLRRIGVRTLFAEGSARYPEVTLEAVAARRPDVVLAPTEPYPFKERHLSELGEVAPARLLDGQDLFWWGTRTPAAIDRLARVVSELRGELGRAGGAAGGRRR